MIWEMLYAKNYFVVVVVAVVVISFLWYYLHELSPENFYIYIYIYIFVISVNISCIRVLNTLIR